VLAADYGRVRAQAPHLRARRHPLEAGIVLGLLVAYGLVVVAIVGNFELPAPD
jgi:hypothetical protein